MVRGGKLLSSLVLLAMTGCGGAQGKLQIRSLPTGLAQGDKPVSFRVAEARGQLALGNVALALEGFRKALREEPASVDATLGIAGCYVRMGRYDLSQRYYETALALEPRNAEALTELAASLEVQGKHERAAAVRGEVAMRSLPVIAEQSAALSGSLQTAAIQSVIVPEARRDNFASAALAGIADLIAPPEEIATAVPVQAPSVTVKLPEARAVPAPVRAVATKAAGDDAAPRLERTSLGEVALITSGAPIWRPHTVRHSRVSTTVRFVPVRREQTRVAAVRLLNAARVNRLAARTRTFLSGKGWERITIGDAPAVRRRSLILYPLEQRAAAERLAAQFGFALAASTRIKGVTIYLGRDAAALDASRAAG